MPVREGFEGKRGTLYRSMMEVVKRTKPLIFVAENVKSLTMNQGGAIKTIAKDFESLGYHVRYKLLLAIWSAPNERELLL